jgi:hypothetical protein
VLFPGGKLNVYADFLRSRSVYHTPGTDDWPFGVWPCTDQYRYQSNLQKKTNVKNVYKFFEYFEDFFLRVYYNNNIMSLTLYDGLRHSGRIIVVDFHVFDQ